MMKPELTREEFDKLSPKQKRQLVAKALAWFCVFESLNPFVYRLHEDEFNTIKIVLGKVKDNEKN